MAAKIEFYENGLLPPRITWQALSFMRCEWPWLFTGDHALRSAPYPADLHITCTDGPVLLSYADIVRSAGVRDGQPVPVYGLSNVFTFPPYRQRGHASAVVVAANEFMDRAESLLAVLFCEPERRSFYTGHGWTAVPEGAIVSPSTAGVAMVRAPAGGQNVAGQLCESPLLLPTAW